MFITSRTKKASLQPLKTGLFGPASDEHSPAPLWRSAIAVQYTDILQLLRVITYNFITEVDSTSFRFFSHRAY